MKRRLETGNRAERHALLLDMVVRIELQRNCVRIGLDAETIRRTLEIPDRPDTPERKFAWLDVPMLLRRRGAELKLVLAGKHAKAGQADPNLVAAAAQGHRWFDELRSGATTSIAVVAHRHSIHQADVSRILPLAFLSPDIVEAILEGRQPVELTAARPKRIRLPHSWADQRRVLRFTD